MKLVKKRLTTVLAASAFAIGALTPVVAMANDYGNWLTCMKNCAGSCTYSGICYLKER